MLSSVLQSTDIAAPFWAAVQVTLLCSIVWAVLQLHHASHATRFALLSAGLLVVALTLVPVGFPAARISWIPQAWQTLPTLAGTSAVDSVRNEIPSIAKISDQRREVSGLPSRDGNPRHLPSVQTSASAEDLQTNSTPTFHASDWRTGIPIDGPPEHQSDNARSIAYSAANALGCIWVFVSLVAMLRLFFGWMVLRRMAAGRDLTDDPRIQFSLAGLRTPLPAGLRVVQCESLRSPALGGFRKPCVFLPSHWEDWSSDRLAAVLAHEIAHARRFDFLVGLATRLVETLYVWHPQVRWLAGELRVQQEIAADRVAVGMLGSVDRYRRCLAEVALQDSYQHFQTFKERLSVPPPTVGWGTHSLIRRIKAMKDSSKLVETVEVSGTWQRIGFAGRWCLLASSLLVIMVGVRLGHAQTPDDRDKATDDVVAPTDSIPNQKASPDAGTSIDDDVDSSDVDSKDGTLKRANIYKAEGPGVGLQFESNMAVLDGRDDLAPMGAFWTLAMKQLQDNLPVESIRTGPKMDLIGLRAALRVNTARVMDRYWDSENHKVNDLGRQLAGYSDDVDGRHRHQLNIGFDQPTRFIFRGEDFLNQENAFATLAEGFVGLAMRRIEPSLQDGETGDNAWKQNQSIDEFLTVNGTRLRAVREGNMVTMAYANQSKTPKNSAEANGPTVSERESFVAREARFSQAVRPATESAVISVYGDEDFVGFARKQVHRSVTAHPLTAILYMPLMDTLGDLRKFEVVADLKQPESEHVSLRGYFQMDNIPAAKLAATKLQMYLDSVQSRITYSYFGNPTFEVSDFDSIVTVEIRYSKKEAMKAIGDSVSQMGQQPIRQAKADDAGSKR